MLSQKNRRTRNRSSTGRPAIGASARVKSSGVVCGDYRVIFCSVRR